MALIAQAMYAGQERAHCQAMSYRRKRDEPFDREAGNTMKAQDGEWPEARACAAVVLYRPDPILLARLAEGLRDRPLFVFANGPVSDEAREALAPAELRFLSSPDNLGLGRGLNVVMEAAEKERFTHVMLLDQDTEPSSDMLDILIGRSVSLERQGERIAVLAPRLVPPEDGHFKPIRYEWRGKPRADGLAAVDFAPTSGSLVSLAAYAKIGPFRDDFFIAGIDVEWGFRAWNLGWSSLVMTERAVVHRWGEAVNEDELGKPQILRYSRARNYYYARNVIAVARLGHVPLRWRIKSCVGLAAQTGLLALKGAPGSLAPVASGLFDGFRDNLGPAPEQL